MSLSLTCESDVHDNDAKNNDNINKDSNGVRNEGDEC